MQRNLILASLSGIGSLLLVTAAYALPASVEFEDWETPLSLTCDTGTTPCSSTQTDVLPLPPGQVTRRATIDVVAGSSSSVSAQSFVTGSPECVTGPTEGCLQFQVTPKTGSNKASLTLDYKFNSALPIDNLGITARNNTSLITGTSFDVAAFYCDSAAMTCQFGDLYKVNPQEFINAAFEFPTGTLTDEVIIVYNPLADSLVLAPGYAPTNIPVGEFDAAVADSDGVLCCIMTNVPEPSTLPLMGPTFAVLAFFSFVRRKRTGPAFPVIG